MNAVEPDFMMSAAAVLYKARSAELQTTISFNNVVGADVCKSIGAILFTTDGAIENDVHLVVVMKILLESAFQLVYFPMWFTTWSKL